MRRVVRVQGLGKKILLMTAAFMLSVSSLTGVVPFVATSAVGAESLAAAKPSDSKKPTVTLTSPLTTPLKITAGTDLVITGSDDKGLKEITADIHSTGQPLHFSVVFTDSRKVGVLTVHTDSLTVGDYDLKYAATNVDGKSDDQGKELTFSVIPKVVPPVVDVTPPSVPVNGNPAVTTTNNFYFTWNASDPGTGTPVVQYQFQSSTSPAVDGTGSLIGAWKNWLNYAVPEQQYLTSTTIHSVGAGDGTYYWQVRAIDGAGNVSAWSSVWTTIIDTTAPTATFAYSNGTTMTNGDVTVTMTASEPIVTPAGWTKVDATHFTKVYSANGAYSVVIADLAGNVSAPQNYEVTGIDKTAPVISGVTNNSTVRGTVSFTVTDDNFSGAAVNGTDVAMTHTTGSDYVITTPIEGDGTYVITATDLAGNTATPVTVTIDNSVESTIDPINTTSATPAMSGLLTYVVDGAGVPGADLFIVVDGTAYPVTTDADGNWSVTPTVANGLHNVFVALGETVLASTSFTTILPTQNPGDTTNPGDGTTTGGTTTPNQTFTTTTASATPVVNGGVPSANYATQGVLGTSTNTSAPADPANTDPTGAADVKGTSTEKKAAVAVDTNNNDGKALGLAWYWWLLIIAGLAALIWWIIAAIRRRRDEEQ